MTAAFAEEMAEFAFCSSALIQAIQAWSSKLSLAPGVLELMIVGFPEDWLLEELEPFAGAVENICFTEAMQRKRIEDMEFKAMMA